MTKKESLVLSKLYLYQDEYGRHGSNTNTTEAEVGGRWLVQGEPEILQQKPKQKYAYSALPVNLWLVIMAHDSLDM